MINPENLQKLSFEPKRDRQSERQILLERYRKPRHRGITNPVDVEKCGHNPYCQDKIDLSLTLDRRHDQIKDIKFEGHGCVLCLVSADLMASVVKGNRIDRALELIEQFHQTIVEQKSLPTNLKKLSILQGVSRYPSRVKCVTLAWHTLKAALIQD
jgi:nitrogen fixation protein NifU and related proteins